MDSIQNSIAIISSIAGLLIGGGGVGILFYKEKKRSIILQNEGSSTDIWKKLVDEVQEQNTTLQVKLDKKDEKIEKLYKDIFKVQNENNTLTTKVGVLEFQKCLNNTCLNRTPPRN